MPEFAWDGVIARDRTAVGGRPRAVGPNKIPATGLRGAATPGVGGVEGRDGTIPLPAERRRNIIWCARDAGLIPITEVGKKDPRQQPSPEHLAQEALQDLEWGAHWVGVEGRGGGQRG